MTFSLGMPGASGECDARSQSDKDADRSAYIGAVAAGLAMEYAIASNSSLKAMRERNNALKLEAMAVYAANNTYEAYLALSAYEDALDAELDAAIAALQNGEPTC